MTTASIPKGRTWFEGQTQKSWDAWSLVFCWHQFPKLHPHLGNKDFLGEVRTKMGQQVAVRMLILNSPTWGNKDKKVKKGKELN
jgi:hypothetical protein